MDKHRPTALHPPTVVLWRRGVGGPHCTGTSTDPPLAKPFPMPPPRPPACAFLSEELHCVTPGARFCSQITPPSPPPPQLEAPACPRPCRRQGQLWELPEPEAPSWAGFATCELSLLTGLGRLQSRRGSLCVQLCLCLRTKGAVSVEPADLGRRRAGS